MKKSTFICQVASALASAFVMLQAGPTPVLAQDAKGADTARLSDKQVRQMLNWMESDSREIGKQAQELEARSRALQTELNLRIAANEAQAAEGASASSAVASDLSVTLTFDDGKVHTFRQDQAKCFEDWVGKTFTQKNCRADDGFWHVSFRPDTTSDRIEVVVELGHVTSDVNAPFMGKGYGFELRKEGEVVAKEDVPFHFWGGRWRWQSAERPILRTCADVKDDPFLPQFSKLQTGNKWKKPKYDGPFTAPEFETGMPNGGERPSIGVVTQWTANCLAGGKIAEKELLALAADYSAAPVHHFRLESGEMIDIRQPEYLGHNFHSNQKGKSDWIASTRPNREDYPNFIIVDTAHHPSLFYVPFLMTEDPFWLEELQYSTLWHLLFTNWERTNNEAGERLTIFKGQMRAFAWGWRDVLHAHYLTPDDAPDWLLPKSFYDTMLDDVAIELGAIMSDKGNDTEAIQRQRYNIMWSNSGWLTAIWMQDFNAPVWGLAVRAGYEQFRPWFEWLMVSINERTKDNGWDRRVPSFYNVDNRKLDFSKAQNWSDLFPLYQQVYSDRFKTPIEKWPEGSYWENKKQYSGTADYVYGGLVVAEWLGYDVKENLDYLEAARNAKAKIGTNKTYDKWSFKR